MTATHTEGPSSYPPSEEFAEQANAREDLYREAERTGWLSGPSKPTGCRGQRRSPRCWTGRSRRSPSGSSAASSTSPTTAWTATSRPATATGWRSTGRASRSATAARSPTRSAGRGVQGGERADRSRPGRRRPGRHLHADDPEAIVAMLACARLGVMHSVVFARLLRDGAARPHRRRRSQGVITADGQFRRGKPRR